MSSEDEEYSGMSDVEESEEQLQQNSLHSEDEEDEEQHQKTKAEDSRFTEQLPEKKPLVTVISLVLPNKQCSHEDGATEKKQQSVQVRLSRWGRRFEAAYSKQLREIQRDNILRSLGDDEVAKRRFLQREDDAAADDGEYLSGDDEGDDDDGAGSEEGRQKVPPPYWLPYLLSSDTFHAERVMSAMYGWVAPPPPPSKIPTSVVSFVEEGDEEVEDEEETIRAEDPARKRSSYFYRSNAFQDGYMEIPEADEEEEDSNPQSEDEAGSGVSSKRVSELDSTALPRMINEKEDVESSSEDIASTSRTQPNIFEHSASIGPRRRSSSSGIQKAPLVSVPAFTDPNYTFYIARDTVSGEWHLLDVHPQLAVVRLQQEKRKREELRRATMDRIEREDARNRDTSNDDEEDETEDDEDEEDENDARDGGDGSEEEDDDNDDNDKKLPAYDMNSVLVMDALMLAAIRSPALLRVMLLQKSAPSLSHVQRWLEEDLDAGFPFLSAIYTSLLSVRAVDAGRLPHELEPLHLDFNFFFRDEYLFSTAAHHFVSSSSSHHCPSSILGERQIEEMASVRSTDGRCTMQALLTAGVTPSCPLQLSSIRNVESARLALWLLMNIPKTMLVEWGKRGRAGDIKGNQVEDEEEQEEEEEEEFEDEEEDLFIAENAIKARIQREERKAREREAALQGPPLLPSPLLCSVLLEVRRRIRRERNGKDPSQHSILLCIGDHFNPACIEDGKTKGDPLVTSAFLVEGAISTLPQNAVTGKVGGPLTRHNAAAATGVVANNAVQRFQRLFQSDLVLLLLALTTTPLCHAELRRIAAKGTMVTVSSENPSPLLQQQKRESLSGSITSASSQRTSAIAPFLPSTGAMATATVTSTAAVVLRHTGGVRHRHSPTDAHLELFKIVLAAKGSRVQSPLSRVRSGTLRLLLLALPCFRQVRLAQHLCDVCPLYQLLGVNERCPLPELVHTWLLERRDDALTRALDTFTNTFWHELHYRFEGGLYDSSVMDYIRQRIGTLLDKVKERNDQYQHVVESLSGRSRHRQGSMRYSSITAFRSFRGTSAVAAAGTAVGSPTEPTSGVHNKTFCGTLQAYKGAKGSSCVFPGDAADTSASPSLQLPNAFLSSAVTLVSPSQHSEQYRREEERVRAMFDSLQMTPRTYFTPETLFGFLFAAGELDTVAVRFLMTVKGVCTVRENPFRGCEMPVLEYALVSRDLRVAQLVVGLGGSLADLMSEGTMTLEAYAEAKFTAEEVAALRVVWMSNQGTIARDPAQKYGIVRSASRPLQV